MTDEQTQEPDDAPRGKGLAPLRRILFSAGAVVVIWTVLSVNSRPSQVLKKPHNPVKTEQAEKAPAKPAESLAEKAPEKEPEKIHEETAEPRPAPQAEAPREMQQAEAPPATSATKEPQDAGAALQGRVAQLEARLKKIEEQPHAAPAADSASRDSIRHLEDALRQQDQAIKALKAQLAASDASRKEATSLQSRSVRQLAALAALDSLKDALYRGESYRTHYDQLYALLKDAPAARDLLGRLRPRADQGMITLPQLQSQFNVLLEKALYPAADRNSLSANLSGLIRVRKVGDQQVGTDDESILARAEAMLARQDLKATLGEMEPLSPPARKTFATWIAYATNVVNAQNTLGELQLAIAHMDAEEKPAPKEATPAAKAEEKKPEEKKPEPKAPAPDVKKQPRPETDSE